MELQAGASLLTRPATEFENDELVEELWAAKAIEHAETYFNLITSVDPKTLRITPFDDEIYKAFREQFSNLNIEIVTDDVLKSIEAKVRWRIFAEMFNRVEDFSYGTLMRANCKKEFTADNSVLLVRIQFLAIEIARNREGYNDFVFEKYRLPPRDIGIPTWIDDDNFVDYVDDSEEICKLAAQLELLTKNP